MRACSGARGGGERVSVMGGKNKKHKGGSGAAGAGAVHPATVAAARAKVVGAAAAESGAAGEAACKRPLVPRPSPAGKELRVKQGTLP